MANSNTRASRALTGPMKRQNDHRIWAQNGLRVDNGRLAEIEANIDDQVGDQWFVAHRRTIAVQLISTKSIGRGGPRAGRVVGGQDKPVHAGVARRHRVDKGLIGRVGLLNDIQAALRQRHRRQPGQERLNAMTTEFSIGLGRAQSRSICLYANFTGQPVASKQEGPRETEGSTASSLPGCTTIPTARIEELRGQETKPTRRRRRQLKPLGRASVEMSRSER